MSKPPPRKKRDATRTRTQLLRAAQWLFSRRAYEQVGIRDVGRRAGVDGSLVRRYFGSKQKLFAEAIRGAFSLDGVLPTEGEADTEAELAAALARAATEPKDRRAFDPMLLLLRSAPNPTLRRLLRTELDDGFIKPLGAALENALQPEGRGKLRATMALACLAGFDLAKTVLQLDEAQREDAKRMLTDLLRVCLRKPG